MAAKCIYINVLSARERYSESGKRAKYRANGRLSARRIIKEFTKKRMVGGSIPMLFLGERSGVGCVERETVYSLCKGISAFITDNVSR